MNSTTLTRYTELTRKKTQIERTRMQTEIILGQEQKNLEKIEASIRERFNLEPDQLPDKMAELEAEVETLLTQAEALLSQAPTTTR